MADRPHVREAVVVQTLDEADLVGLAQAFALDATTFPHPSLPPFFASKHAAPSVWIARAAAVVGFVVGHTRGVVFEVAGLAVEPTFRRSGVGRALLETLIDAARIRGVSALRLHVSTANEAAIKLYDSEGFAVMRKLPSFYAPKRFPNRGDAYEMVLLLD